MSATTAGPGGSSPGPLSFGPLLLALCAERGLSLSALARLCGVRQQSLWELSRGLNRPSLDTARRVCAALGLSLDHLCNRLPPVDLPGQ